MIHDTIQRATADIKRLKAPVITKTASQINDALLSELGLAYSKHAVAMAATALVRSGEASAARNKGGKATLYTLHEHRREAQRAGKGAGRRVAYVADHARLSAEMHRVPVSLPAEPWTDLIGTMRTGAEQCK